MLLALPVTIILTLADSEQACRLSLWLTGEKRLNRRNPIATFLNVQKIHLNCCDKDGI